MTTALNHEEVFQKVRSTFTDNNYAKMGKDELYNLVLDARKILAAERDPPLDEAVASDFVPPMIKTLKQAKDIENRTKFEVVWILTNIASGESKHVNYLLKQGLLPLCSEFLETGDPELLLQTIWLIGNITGDGNKPRDIVLRLGFVQKMLQLFERPLEVRIVRNIAFTMSNMMRFKPAPALDLVQGLLPALQKLLGLGDKETLIDTLWALSYFTEREDDESGNLFLQTVSLPRIIELANPDHFSHEIVTPALRVIGNLTTGSDNMCQAVLDVGCLGALKKLIPHPKKAIRKEACWALSNITAGSPHQISMVIESGILQLAIDRINTNDSIEVRKEALFVLANLTSGANPEDLFRAVCTDYICALASPVLHNNQEHPVLMVSLEGLESCLRVAEDLDPSSQLPEGWPQHIRPEKGNVYAQLMEELGVVDTLVKALDSHPEHEISDKVFPLLATYFGDKLFPTSGAEDSGNGATDAVNPPDEAQPYGSSESEPAAEALKQFEQLHLHDGHDDDEMEDEEFEEEEQEQAADLMPGGFSF